MKDINTCLNSVHGGYSAPESIVIKLYPLDPLCQSQFRGGDKLDIYIEESLDWDEE